MPTRIVVIGSSCAGKSTFAEQLAERTGLLHTQLDELYWLPDWVARDPVDFIARVMTAASEDNWVMDGNYKAVRPHLWPRATTLIWLNYSFPRVLWQCLKRSIHRCLTKKPLYAGNVESFRKTFLSKDSIIWWVLTTYHEKRRRYETLLSTDAAAHCVIHEFRNPSQAQAYLREFART